MSKLPIFLFFILLFTAIPQVEARTTPNFVVNVGEDTVNVSWQMRFNFRGETDYAEKIRESRLAYEVNYERHFETALEIFLSKQFSSYLDRRVTVKDLQITLSGDGDDWTKWMEVHVEFTVQNLHYEDSNGTSIDMRWFGLKLTDEKVGFEDKEHPRIKHRFVPKYMLGFNWEGCWGAWDLTARESEQTANYRYVLLPARHKYRPFTEYQVSGVPSDPLLEIRIPLDAEFKSNTVFFPTPPEPPTWQELLWGKIQPVIPLLGLAFVGGVAIGVAVVWRIRTTSWKHKAKSYRKKLGEVEVSNDLTGELIGDVPEEKKGFKAFIDRIIKKIQEM